MIKLLNKLLFSLIFPLLLFLLGCALLYYQNLDFGIFSIVSYDNSIKLDKEFSFKKGNVFNHQITLVNGNLGLVGVKFDNNLRINPGQVEFRIRKISDTDWSYIQRHNVDQFQPNDFFSFGFTPRFSAGDTVEFEIEYTGEVNDEYISLSFEQPIVLYVYKVDRDTILGSFHEMINFVTSKTYYMFGDNRNIKLAALYLQPFFIYIVSIYLYKVKPENYSPHFVLFSRFRNLGINNQHLILTFLTYFNSLIVSNFNILVLGITLGGMYFLKKLLKVGDQDLYLLAFTTIFFVPFFVYIKLDQFAQNLSIFTIIFLIWATCSAIYKQIRQ